MLENEVNTNLKDNFNNSPFSIQIKHKDNSFELIETFLKFGVNLQNLFELDKNISLTAFLFIIYNGESNIENLKWWISKGSNINETDSEGNSALIYAIKKNNKKIIKFILENEKFDKNLKDKNGKNPIFYVVNPIEFGSYENIEILDFVCNYFNINEEDNFGKYKYNQIYFLILKNI